jgi:ceramide glucosyltransferase
MHAAALLAQALLAIPIAVGCVYACLRVAAALAFRLRRPAAEPAAWPAVSILKPVCGLEEGLEENLSSVCAQDYPGPYQVVLSAQRSDDPALPILRRLALELGPERVTLAVASGEPRANGKVFNLANALRAARHEVLLISDSDVRVPPDHLRAIVAPLADPRVGYAQTLYRGSGARRWFERLELLSLHDFVADVVFAFVTGASGFCLGSSVALRRATLDAIGGFDALSEYLVEDYEMGRRIRALGLGLALVRRPVDTVVSLASARAWWEHQLYWDQNTRQARPIGFLATILIRPVPFALLLALGRLFDPLGAAVLAGALALRLATAAAAMALLGEREGLRSLLWLPARDLAALGTWLVALRRRSVVWRGIEFALTSDGRMRPLGPARPRRTAHGSLAPLRGRR